MMTIPLHLLNPPAGGWPVSEAAILWAELHYGIERSAPDTIAIRRTRGHALREVLTVATPPPAPKAKPKARPQGDGFAPAGWGIGCNDPPAPPRPPRPNWVSVSALAALADRHGIPYGSAPTAPVVAIVGPEKPVAAKTRRKPGPKRAPDMQRAIDATNERIAQGWEPGLAAEESAEEFNVDRASVERMARRDRESQT